MEAENNVDNSTQISDNTGNDVDEVIRMDGKPPINNPNCEHDYAIDPSDTLGDYVAWMCTKPNCGLGQWRKNQNPS